MTQPADRPDLSVVIPVYNQEETISEPIRRLTAVFDAVPQAGEVVRTDDCKPRGLDPSPWDAFIRAFSDDVNRFFPPEENHTAIPRSRLQAEAVIMKQPADRPGRDLGNVARELRYSCAAGLESDPSEKSTNGRVFLQIPGTMKATLVSPSRSLSEDSTTRVER